MQVNFILIILLVAFFVILGIGLFFLVRYINRANEKDFRVDSGKVKDSLAKLDHHTINRVEAGIRMKTVGSWRSVSAYLDLVLTEGNILLLPAHGQHEVPSIQIDSHQGNAIRIPAIQCYSNTSAVFFDHTGTIQVEVECGRKKFSFSILTSKRVEDLKALLEKYDIQTHSPY